MYSLVAFVDAICRNCLPLQCSVHFMEDCRRFGLYLLKIQGPVVKCEACGNFIRSYAQRTYVSQHDLDMVGNINARCSRSDNRWWVRPVVFPYGR